MDLIGQYDGRLTANDLLVLAEKILEASKLATARAERLG
jgi:hypothetical protein